MRTSVAVTWVPRGSRKVARASMALTLVFFLVFSVAFSVLILTIIINPTWQWWGWEIVRDKLRVVFITLIVSACLVSIRRGLFSEHLTS